GAATRQVALGADAFLGVRGLLAEAVLLKAARPLALARRLGAVLSHVHADFFLLGHATAPRVTSNSAIVPAATAIPSAHPGEPAGRPGSPAVAFARLFGS